ncbi:MAG: hypothetical protein PHE04_00650 [Bacteroidales bacterium]|nr:hypothetical protein [Bacteroidales bacterium]MDD3430476.1 hypothetical protein [Bacteroidales bacterium]MDD4360912.1 hypothetical protein [Bacteroidales bacterium]MDD4429832.1 hypothetical protein [Bacteroidales bacterium]
MSRLFVLIISLLISLPFSAQNTSLGATQNLAQSETSVKTWNLYGFVRSDFFAQNRNTRTAVLDLFPLYPMPEYLNGIGEDLNNSPSAGLSSITTRMGLKFNSAGILGAKKHTGIIETDFGGSSDYILMRIRKAYSQLDWENSHLIVGQTWHPLFVEHLMPNVVSLNTGAPYQAFNRSPQIRYNYRKEDFNLTAAVVYQLMYASSGPKGKSIQYQKDAVIPNLFFGAEYNNGKLIAGIGGDFKALRPERTYKDIADIEHINTKLLNTYSGTAYLMYTHNKFMLMSKTLLGQNLSDHSIIGGYIIDDKHNYLALNSLASFAQIQYGKLHQLGLFGGYSAILGSTKSTEEVNYDFYGFGAELIPSNNSQYQYIKDMFRVMLTYTYNPQNWRLGLELEYNAANWGDLSKNSINQFKISAKDYTAAYRLHAIVMYLF